MAVRNAQLYQQVPLAGFLKPLLEKRRRLLKIPLRRRQAWGIGAAAVLLALIVSRGGYGWRGRCVFFRPPGGGQPPGSTAS